MVDTEPRYRELLLEQYPQLAAFERTAVRLHPRAGSPTVEDSSVGGPMVWPAGEAWPVCTDEHELAPGQPDPGEVQMIPVLQFHRRDLPSSRLLPPAWMFPDGSDLLQLLWCPHWHTDTSAPRARLFWRERASLGQVELIDPASTTYPDQDEFGLYEHIPRPCVLHPELVREYPPITIDDPEDDDYAESFYGILPPELEVACARWTVPDRPWDDGDERDPTEQDYTEHCTVPGWKLGGWVPHVGFWPRPAEHCECGAPTFLLLAATFEDTHGPWLPRQEPEFRWKDPADGWDGNRPTGVWGGRNGLMWLQGCRADPHHPILVDTE